MVEIKVSREEMMNHASDLSESMAGMSYFPMKNGNMPYTQSEAISNYREALFELVESVDLFGKVVREDAIRIKQIGEAYAAKDKEVAQQLEVR
ncbi:hypothetical protein PWEIH_16713 [Listeria weihenstephanensis FSL R9-0317]|uniref:DUF3130 family protein n=1 Tax=Listeria weihenstephanensis TaxID=1006155 RepID=A0A1S7FXG3_9LIST|nr:DUF3130 family protein [Listeria weihenstephanensis]AQY52092.1 hypothetical protein UE46_14405 [Listeria weihenstephanensis]EUJ34739.1 hypothetical protein PWEIH_16713 [Listeria weihenstephanensis FSL R9-0317]